MELTRSRRPLVREAIVLVLQQVAWLLYPSFLTSSLLVVLRRHVYSWSRLPSWAVFLSSLISIPTFHIGKAMLRDALISRKAAKMGAQTPPRWKGKTIAGIDLLRELIEDFQTGFLSELLLKKMQEKAPTLELFVLWDRNVMTTDTNVIKTVLATDFTSWVKGKAFSSYVRSVLGTGFLNSDGDLWRFHRTLTRPFFTKERISHFDLFDRHAERTINKLRERVHSGYAVDFQDLISRFTLDSATEFLFGSCVNSLDTDLPYPYNAPPLLRARAGVKGEDFASAFAEAQRVCAHRIRVGWIWPWYELFKDATEDPMRVVDAVLEPILNAALKRAAQNKKSAIDQQKIGEIEEHDTLLDHLVKHTSDYQLLHDQILNMMVAGRDTTAGTLTVCIYFLSQHPEVLRRVRDEVLSKVGSTSRPTHDDIRYMKYLRAVINETLRLYPAVPWNIRYAVKDTFVPSDDPNRPYFVAANTPLSYSVYCMHRRTDYWGPDAEKFDPDRFIDHRVQQYLTPNPFIFLPFNAGPRICLGQQFAYNEMSFFLVRLLQNFETISLDLDSLEPSCHPRPEWAGSAGRKGIEKFWPKVHLTLYSDGGMWVKMGEASNL